MIQQVRIRVGSMVASLLFVLPMVAGAQDAVETGVPADKAVALKQQVFILEQNIEESEKEAAGVQKDFIDYQQKAAYSNEQTRTLYHEIKYLEKQLVEKKKQMAEVMEKQPEFRDIEKRRAAVYARLSKLREDLQFKRQELDKLRTKANGEKEPAK